MSITDIAEFAGLLFSAWAIGFTGGYAITKFREAINAAI